MLSTVLGSRSVTTDVEVVALVPPCRVSPVLEAHHQIGDWASYSVPASQGLNGDQRVGGYIYNVDYIVYMENQPHAEGQPSATSPHTSMLRQVLAGYTYIYIYIHIIDK